MRMAARLIEDIESVLICDATTAAQPDGTLALGDGVRVDWHLLRWTDPRLNGARVECEIEYAPTPACDTTIYFHQYGGADVCGIDQHGKVAFNDCALQIRTEQL